MKTGIKTFLCVLINVGLSAAAFGADPGLTSGSCAAGAEDIVAAIEPPRIPDQQFNIVDFGALSGGSEDARPAILNTIKHAATQGGGKVILPPGLWLSNGPIVLQSNIELHIADGARLLFSPNPADYLPAVLNRWEGTEVYSHSPLIYARDVHDVAITGKGIIDGNQDSEFFGWHPREKPDQLALRKMGFSDVPVAQRQFGEGHLLRPSLIQFFSAERVLLTDYTARNSPFWVNHLVFTEHAIIRGVRVDSHHANNDGVDVDSSRYVLVEHNHFRTGDDAVVVKSGRDLDGRKRARPSEYVVIRHNDMGGEDGVALGSEMSGDIRHVYFTDNILRTGSAAIRFKSNLDRGGVVEQIRVCNMQVESFQHLFWFQLNYPGELGGNFPPLYRDILFENIGVEKASTALEVHAPEGFPLQNVTFRNIDIKHADTTFVLENAENLVFENLKINGERIDGRLDWR
ncbi:glycoside hydrolase family 28 protein [Pseudomaricurvus alcaniphilus]|uniref:glycoside hydrolase family 28 protein n=1 Tax=Pseudomaricurvus alcaniphilus TaxID=1166482 RepID=UPI0014095030|nr:glycoside hydrolase family 28 protein [Pseudomaricurvus alcaniphilus]NHN36796.1 glycoside hydrolase family 28 protein [Pseudomaricurvus alcaniphilus]